ncbi:MAG: hypothetical protein QMC17_03280 [Paracoccaceae bacterium]|jgi:hypothetical protein
MKPLIDPKHPFFRKVWVRWASVLIPFIWIFIELSGGGWGWAILMAGLAAYAFWVLIWNWRDPNNPP